MSFAATTHTLLDHCAFEKANICGMIQGTRDDADWDHEDSTRPGQVDHTLVGQCTGGWRQKVTTWGGSSGSIGNGNQHVLPPLEY